MHKYSYKIFIQENKLDNYHWGYFFNTIFDYGKNFDFEVSFDGNEIDFYLFHKKRGLWQPVWRARESRRID